MMRSAEKIWLILGAVLIIIGIAVFAVAFAYGGFDIADLETVKYEKKVISIDEEFSDILIKTGTADVEILHSDDGEFKVVCHESRNEKHIAEVINGVMTVTVSNTRKWYEYIGIGISIGSPKVTLYMPKDEYGRLAVKVGTGDVTVQSGFAFDTADISLSTGDVHIYDVLFGEFSSIGSTGDISLANVIVKERLFIKRSTGDVTFDGCDAGEIFVKTTTGDIEGSLLSEKIFITDVKTGKVNVPNSTSGGVCDVAANTGNVKLYIK